MIAAPRNTRAEILILFGQTVVFFATHDHHVSFQTIRATSDDRKYAYALDIQWCSGHMNDKTV